MSHEVAQPRTAGRASILRAGRALAVAVFTRTGSSFSRAPRRLSRTVFIGALMAGGAAAAFAAAGPNATLSGDRAAIETVVRDYILAHPEIISEAMKRLEAQRVTGLIDANRSALETPYAGAWEGAATPEVTLVAFMDYACGYCRASLPDIAKLLGEDKGLRVVYRELPIISEGSIPAARVSLYAAEAGRFAAFHKAMFAQGGVDTDKIVDAAGKAGLDKAKVRAELVNGARNQLIGENVRLAQSLEASGTPIFIVGDQIFYGAVGYDALKEAIAKARNKAG